MWVLWQKIRPVGWQTALLMLRSLNLHKNHIFMSILRVHNSDRLHLEYLQIAYRYTNDIKHSFIFKKGFINLLSPYNGIIEYKTPFHYHLILLSNSTIFLPSLYGQSILILSMSFSLNSSVFPLHISTIWAGLSVMLQPICHSPFSIKQLASLFSSYTICFSPNPRCISACPETKFHNSDLCSCLCIDKHENGLITNSLTLNPFPMYKSL